MDFGKFIFGIDNLFKFLGLSGLVIIVFSLVYPNKIQIEIDFNIIDYNKQKAVLEKEIEHIKLKVRAVQNDTAKAKEKVRILAYKKDSITATGKNLSLIKEFDSQKAEIRENLRIKFDSLEELVFQESLKSIELKSTEDKIKVAQTYLNEYKRYFWILLLLGTCMSIYGFVRWHSSQADADDMQKTQLEISKKQLNSMP